MKVAAGSYYVKVFTPKNRSSTPYRVRLRVLPEGVFTLDQAAYFGSYEGVPTFRAVATFYNNTTQWQALESWTIKYYDAQGAEIEPPGTTVGGGRLDLGLTWIAPGGATSVNSGWSTTSKATTRVVLTPEATVIAEPASTGLSIKQDTRHANAVTRSDGMTFYWVKITNTSSRSRATTPTSSTSRRSGT